MVKLIRLIGFLIIFAALFPDGVLPFPIWSRYKRSTVALWGVLVVVIGMMLDGGRIGRAPPP